MGKEQAFDECPDSRPAKYEGASEVETVGEVKAPSELPGETAEAQSAREQREHFLARPSCSTRPVPIPKLNGVTAIGARGGTACATVQDGRVYCWGWLLGKTSDVQELEAARGADQITLSAERIYARRAGRMIAIPSDDEPQDWLQVAATADGGCLLLASRRVLCTGKDVAGVPRNKRSQCTQRYVAKAACVPEGIETVVSLSSGQSSVCALDAESHVSCWGAYSGIKGIDSLTPTNVSGLDGIEQIAVGGTHFCALDAGGSVICFGGNNSGELGDGSTVSRAEPARVAGLPAIAQVTAGRNHICALGTNGAVYCWGNNRYGQIGDGTRENRLRPVKVLDTSEAPPLRHHL